mmetsp:Transcript_8713/g.15570  ORF Transcript_8713/g.15570 Transcript_8713/m.15570 type:complete len:107 (-) Transcript_8713:140-460(-)
MPDVPSIHQSNLSGSWEPRGGAGGGGDAADAAGGGVSLSRGNSYTSGSLSHSHSLSRSGDSKLEPPPSPDEYAAFRTLESAQEKEKRGRRHQAPDVYANADVLYRR